MDKLKKEDDNEERLDIFIARTNKNISRAYAKVLIKEGHIKLNGKKAKSSFSVKQGDIVNVDYVAPVLKEKILLPLTFVYEDDDVAVVDKPKGMAVHSGTNNYKGTLVGEFKKRDLMLPNGEVGVLHRLDKDTSGLIILAKSEQALHSLAKDIKQGNVSRSYVGLVEGTMPQEKGQIKTFIGPNPKDRRMMMIYRTNDGQIAITDYEVLETFVDKISKKYQLVKFILQTGRTHQIRVHAKHCGASLVGDEKYGADKNLWHIKGQMLQSNYIRFTHPTTKKEIELSLPLNEDFKKVISELSVAKISKKK